MRDWTHPRHLDPAFRPPAPDRREPPNELTKETLIPPLCVTCVHFARPHCRQGATDWLVQKIAACPLGLWNRDAFV